MRRAVGAAKVASHDAALRARAGCRAFEAANSISHDIELRPEQAVEAAKVASQDAALRPEQPAGDCEAASQSAHSRSKRGQDNGEGLSAKCIATAHRAFWSDCGGFCLGAWEPYRRGGHRRFVSSLRVRTTGLEFQPSDFAG